MLLERRPNFLVMVAHLDKKEEELFAVFLLFVRDVYFMARRSTEGCYSVSYVLLRTHIDF